MSITCLTESHRRPDNPLRRDQRLGIVHAVEYGAQAAAVHGGLLAGKPVGSSGSAYLAALRDGRFFVEFLDDLEAPLVIRAERQLADASNLIYGFEVCASERVLADGRIVVMRPGEARR